MIPSTPDWETQDTSLNGELREFVTSFYIPADDGTESEYAGGIFAHSFEEAKSICASIRFPRTIVRGVLGGRVSLHRMN